MALVWELSMHNSALFPPLAPWGDALYIYDGKTIKQMVHPDSLSKWKWNFWEVVTMAETDGEK